MRIQDAVIYKENFLKNVLWMGGFRDEEFQRGCERYGVCIRSKEIYMIQLSVKNWKEVVLHYKAGALLHLYTEIERSTEKLFQRFPKHESFYSEPYAYHILMNLSKKESKIKEEEVLWKLVHEMAAYLEEEIQAEVVLGVYRNVFETENLNRGFQESLRLVEQHFFWPQKKVFWNGLLHTYQEADMQELDRALESLNEKKTGFADTAWNYLVRQWDTLMCREEFLNIIGKALEKQERIYGEPFEKELENYADMYTLLNDIRLYEKKIKNERENASSSFLVKQARQIIQNDFRNSLTLGTVAKDLGISTGYLSRIFHRETGKNFSEYLTERRIDYAKERIAGTNDKIYEIAVQCGFKSAVHFDRMFRKYCGITPTQYREQFGYELIKKS